MFGRSESDPFKNKTFCLVACLQAPWEVEDKKPPPEWPVEGNVDFQGYSVRYREGLDLVLKRLTLSVKGGEKVRRAGVTCRTMPSLTTTVCTFLYRSVSWVVRGLGSPP